MSRATPVREVLHAPAKLTLSLRVTGVRADGMHTLDAEMITIDLFDTIEISPREAAEAGGSSVVLRGAGDDVPVGADNLVNRALDLVGRRASVVVNKRIPSQAGLGGGSADAAAILRWAGFSDLAAAASLGADVAFCVVGGRARVTGIGEIVEPLPFVPTIVTMLTPPVRCSTAEVYRAWDRLGGPEGPGANDLLLAALEVAPELAHWRDRLGDETGREPQLAGSGSTWFVPGAFPGRGRRVARAIPSSGAT
jgi:4-diphosphocytidyl-2-C-methyl-D-erythritol kinase